MTTFSTLPLDPRLLPGLDALNLQTLTPIQQQALPALLEGRDLLGRAPTGSGKTVAFALALLSRIDLGLTRVQAVVLCPTRELADQVGKQIRKLAVGLPNLKLSLLYGGVALQPQIASLAQHDPHVVVGTPGRIQELLRKKHLHLRSVRTLVLDEADRMLDMGFEEAMREVVGRIPADRQTLLFSATFPDAIRAIADSLMREPVEVHVEGAASAPKIEEWFYEVTHGQRIEHLIALLRAHQPDACVVFCNTRQDVSDVATQLQAQGISALALHGDLEQRERDEVLVRFAQHSCRILVASDVAARGLDIVHLDMVANFELPTDAESYQHRIGRTARAGRDGVAINLVSPREMPRALALEKARGAAINWGRIPPPSTRQDPALPAPMTSLRIDAGKTDKLRPGDILGALTGSAGLPASVVGKIDIFPTRSYVAIARDSAGKALDRLRLGRIKGRNFRVRSL
ncbi:MAG: ATP-dependent RNA helicase DbpA [Xanthomonadales bacterium]|nr:ATP-dependent RNA helicase DbpA [Xanthomonadales bacterium]